MLETLIICYKHGFLAAKSFVEPPRYPIEQAPDSRTDAFWMLKMQPSAGKTAAG
jgi:hypothetical protein